MCAIKKEAWFLGSEPSLFLIVFRIHVGCDAELLDITASNLNLNPRTHIGYDLLKISHNLNLKI